MATPVSKEVYKPRAAGNHEYTYKRKGGDHGPDPSGSRGYDPDWANFGNGEWPCRHMATLPLYAGSRAVLFRLRLPLAVQCSKPCDACVH